jgi:hypothetical protein
MEPLNEAAGRNSVFRRGIHRLPSGKRRDTGRRRGRRGGGTNGTGRGGKHTMLCSRVSAHMRENRHRERFYIFGDERGRKKYREERRDKGRPRRKRREKIKIKP